MIAPIQDIVVKFKWDNICKHVESIQEISAMISASILLLPIDSQNPDFNLKNSKQSLSTLYLAGSCGCEGRSLCPMKGHQGALQQLLWLESINATDEGIVSCKARKHPY